MKNESFITNNILYEQNIVQHRPPEWEILSFLFVMQCLMLLAEKLRLTTVLDSAAPLCDHGNHFRHKVQSDWQPGLSPTKSL